MCDPLTIGSLAVSAAGAGLTAYEQNKTTGNMIAARNAATRSELERNHGYQKEARSQFDRTADQFTPENQAQALASEKSSVADAFRSNAPTSAEAGSISTAGAPRVVADSANKSVADAFGRADKMNNALGNVAGWDQRFFKNNINLNDSARNLDLTSDFARTSAAVNGLEQTAAYNNAYKPPSGIGDILQFAGNVGAFKAGGGKLPFFGNSAPVGQPLSLAAPAVTAAPAIAPQPMQFPITNKFFGRVY